MTYEKAVSLYNDAVESSSSDYLFDGEQNKMGVINAIEYAFGIREAREESLCDHCRHWDDCPFMSSYGQIYEHCNFHEEVSR